MLFLSTGGIKIFYRTIRIPIVRCMLNKYSVLVRNFFSTDFQSGGEKPSKRGRVSGTDFQPKQLYLYQTLSKSG